MSTNAKIGHGSQFLIQNDTSPASLISVGEIQSIKPPGISRDAPDATHMDSPNGWREFLGGLKDGGEASCDINFVPGSVGVENLLNQFDLPTPTTCRIVFPDGSRFDFTAFLTGFETDAPVDDKMTVSVTFKVTGQPVFTVVA